MDGYQISNPVGIPAGSMLRIDDGASVLVYVCEGELWLTQEGIQKDHVLQAGQAFRVDRGGATIAYAFRPSLVSLSSPTPDVPVRQISLIGGTAQSPVILHRDGEPRTLQILRRLMGAIFATPPAAANS